MARADRMTVEEVVRKVLCDEHADVVREAVKAVAAEMMELEVVDRRPSLQLSGERVELHARVSAASTRKQWGEHPPPLRLAAAARPVVSSGDDRPLNRRFDPT